MERQVKGIWIPIEIWEDKSLSWNEKILLMEIDSFTSQGIECFFSDEYVAGMLGIHITNANKVLSSLIKKGFVKKVKFDGRRRFVQSRLGENTKADLAKTPRQTWQNDRDNNIDEQISINTISIKGKFSKPTIEGIEQYCILKGYDLVNAEAFFNYYESNGWKVGKNKMQNWHSAVAGWQTRAKEERKTPSPTPSPKGKKSALQANLELADEMFGTHDAELIYGNGR